MFDDNRLPTCSCQVSARPEQSKSFSLRVFLPSSAFFWKEVCKKSRPAVRFSFCASFPNKERTSNHSCRRIAQSLCSDIASEMRPFELDPPDGFVSQGACAAQVNIPRGHAQDSTAVGDDALDRPSRACMEYFHPRQLCR